MIPIIYGSIFTASLLCTAIYVFIWHKHFNVNISLIFAFVPIVCLGHYLYSIAGDLGEALTAQKLIYLGSSFLQMFILFSITNLCQIEIKNWIRTLLFFLCTVVFTGALTIGHSDLFYTNISFSVRNGTVFLIREYGPMHTLYYVVVVAFFAIGFAAICYSWAKKKQVPRTIIILLVIPYVIVLGSYFIGKEFGRGIDVMTLGYLLAQIMYLVIAARMNLYDVADTAIDSMVRERAIGYISFDFRYRYLGSNETARLLVPDLNRLAVDEVLGNGASGKKIRHFLDSFRHDEKYNQFIYTFHSEGSSADEEKIYNVNVNYLYEGSWKRGYIVTFTDDTANRKYIRLLDNYNEKLQTEVDQKTQHIVEMHNNLIMSLAVMVESRDNSTGGHIKRTSTGVRILIDEIKKEGTHDLTPEFCRDIVKAAPMHDLGKIAVDDAILRKPGRFTEEEFAIMKQHAAEGARVIHEILRNTDDESFKVVAENVAHYHHERWDGSGYPEGLSGEQIPFEARVMAIADVYDALVSKRVYKEAFSYEKANQIIMEGMGTQFDPGLKTVYEHAKPRLEAYYGGLEEG
ncbi:MAG: HD domain-containing protein [Lachnospiraceae bacterium]|nr:HD domain-containing protein [Lachnospiraceae bacterium]